MNFTTATIAEQHRNEILSSASRRRLARLARAASKAGKAANGAKATATAKAA
jgi:hypothetical protein